MRALTFLTLLLLGAVPAAAVSVAASIVPVRSWAEEILGEPVAVVVQPGQNPSLYEPAARQLAELSRCDLVLLIGAPAEAIVFPRLRRMNPAIDAIDLSEGLTPVSATARAHGEAHGHGHLDPHLWTSPLAVARIVETLGQVLAPRSDDPEAARARARDLAQRWRALHEDLAGKLAPLAGATFLVYHPAFGHFAESYGLEQLAVEDDGVEPGAKHMRRLAERIREERIGTLFYEPQFAPQRAIALARSLGVRPVVVDPLSEDLMAELRRLADVLVEDHAVEVRP